MKKYTPKYNQCLQDVAIQEIGGIEGVFSIAMENGITITDHLPQGELNIPKRYINTNVVAYYHKNKIAAATAVGVQVSFDFQNIAISPSTLKRLEPNKVEYGQSLQDLTLQTAGSLEHIFEMALLNGVSITDNPVAGAKYSALEAEHSDIVGYYATKGIKPATGLTAEAQLQQLFETGLFEFGLFE